MTAPSESQQLASLAALAEAHPELPPPGLQRDLLRLNLIGTARDRGVTWAQIGQVLGYGGPKATKSAAKRLQRRCASAVLAATPVGGPAPTSK